MGIRTISNYTNYCTEAQTKKALELGILIEKSDTPTTLFDEKRGWIKIPTLEEMVGWLDDQGLSISVEAEPFKGGNCDRRWISKIHNINSLTNHHSYPCLYWNSGISRKDVTIYAIDAALDYLIKYKYESTYQCIYK